ncbi:CCR4-NOT transcription complex subunit 4, putative [Plasmodium chabaudi chabaudi]|uniref:CCR4-NOT transcription complex subunit 4, putative n=1 Tax=Plasmodium chabaudi chabaudi TaxID=31271 RepID=A0A4V0KDV9_PLACU|nr:CCR4-NOT transcription complex subunit 4, putative [Plasmodium chabaudi chabaudi]VTZ71197.1 CCR4-NOT transcription complex subunit 4, putative [Plasmodium chabaudi chabaudi]|eukprot:XP_740256.2 CCR4-NOT transcription complex subunit 4, putative [Plasmodium chabaudi chabaudi]
MRRGGSDKRFIRRTFNRPYYYKKSGKAEEWNSTSSKKIKNPSNNSSNINTKAEGDEVDFDDDEGEEDGEQTNATEINDHPPENTKNTKRNDTSSSNNKIAKKKSIANEKDAQTSTGENNNNVICPLCVEQLDETDRNFFPCDCGYQICLWCLYYIRDHMSNKCPACRRSYDEKNFIYNRETHEKLLKKTKNQHKNKGENNTNTATTTTNNNTSNSNNNSGSGASSTSIFTKNDLYKNSNIYNIHEYDGILEVIKDIRVVQRNLVFVIGITENYAKKNILKKNEHFGKYGQISNIIINKSQAFNPQYNGPSFSAYITYSNEKEAINAIYFIDGMTLDNKTLKASFGTTKYCSSFLKNYSCVNEDCFYLHELGNVIDSFSKEDIHGPKHIYHDLLYHYFKKLPDGNKKGDNVAVVNLLSNTTKVTKLPEQQEENKNMNAPIQNVATSTPTNYITAVNPDIVGKNDTTSDVTKNNKLITSHNENAISTEFKTKNLENSKEFVNKNNEDLKNNLKLKQTNENNNVEEKQRTKWNSEENFSNVIKNMKDNLTQNIEEDKTHDQISKTNKKNKKTKSEDVLTTYLEKGDKKNIEISNDGDNNKVGIQWKEKNYLNSLQSNPTLDDSNKNAQKNASEDDDPYYRDDMSENYPLIVDAAKEKKKKKKKKKTDKKKTAEQEQTNQEESATKKVEQETDVNEKESKKKKKKGTSTIPEPEPETKADGNNKIISNAIPNTIPNEAIDNQNREPPKKTTEIKKDDENVEKIEGTEKKQEEEKKKSTKSSFKIGNIFNVFFDKSKKDGSKKKNDKKGTTTIENPDKTSSLNTEINKKTPPPIELNENTIPSHKKVEEQTLKEDVKKDKNVNEVDKVTKEVENVDGKTDKQGKKKQDDTKNKLNKKKDPQKEISESKEDLSKKTKQNKENTEVLEIGIEIGNQKNKESFEKREDELYEGQNDDTFYNQDNKNDKDKKTKNVNNKKNNDNIIAEQIMHMEEIIKMKNKNPKMEYKQIVVEYFKNIYKGKGDKEKKQNININKFCNAINYYITENKLPDILKGIDKDIIHTSNNDNLGSSANISSNDFVTVHPENKDANNCVMTLQSNIELPNNVDKENDQKNDDENIENKKETEGDKIVKKKKTSKKNILQKEIEDDIMDIIKDIMIHRLQVKDKNSSMSNVTAATTTTSNNNSSSKNKKKNKKKIKNDEKAMIEQMNLFNEFYEDNVLFNDLKVFVKDLCIAKNKAIKNDGMDDDTIYLIQGEEKWKNKTKDKAYNDYLLYANDDNLFLKPYKGIMEYIFKKEINTTTSNNSYTNLPEEIPHTNNNEYTTDDMFDIYKELILSKNTNLHTANDIIFDKMFNEEINLVQQLCKGDYYSQNQGDKIASSNKKGDNSHIYKLNNYEKQSKNLPLNYAPNLWVNFNKSFYTNEMNEKVNLSA